MCHGACEGQRATRESSFSSLLWFQKFHSDLAGLPLPAKPHRPQAKETSPLTLLCLFGGGHFF